MMRHCGKQSIVSKDFMFLLTYQLIKKCFNSNLPKSNQRNEEDMIEEWIEAKEQSIRDFNNKTQGEDVSTAGGDSAMDAEDASAEEDV